MDLLDALIHLFNFLAPAFWLALGLACWGYFLNRKKVVPLSWKAQAALNFVAGGVVFGGVSMLLGRDGKMLAYVALVLTCASVQWLGQRSWREVF
jgi:hypothetical protein